MKLEAGEFMRAWVLTVALSVTLVGTPMWAQRGGGGGHGGGGFGGGHGFSGGGHVGGVSGAHGFAGGGVTRGPVYSYAGRGPVFSVNPRGVYSNGYGWRGNNWGWRGNGWRGYPYRYPWGWRGYPYWGYYGLGWYPFWGWGGGYGWYDSGYDYGDDYYPDYSNSNYSAPPTYPSDVYLGAPSGGGYAQDEYAANDATQSQIQQLQGQVSQLQAQAANRAPSPKFEEIHSDTVLVYKDGRKQEIQNYAIVGKTLWIMNENRATKVPLSDLNLAATKRDNEERGIDFNVPGTQR
jgi:hypothetical protein